MKRLIGVFLIFCTGMLCGTALHAQRMADRTLLHTLKQIPHRKTFSRPGTTTATIGLPQVQFVYRGGLYDHGHKQPLFCRIESEMERKSSLAPRIRLGSLEYVNWLEGKMQ